MEKKKRIIRTIICIATTILIAGCVILMAFLPSINKTQTASAESNFPPTEPTNPPETIEETGLSGIEYTGEATGELSQYQIIFTIKEQKETESSTMEFVLDKIYQTNVTVTIQMRYYAYRDPGTTVLIQGINSTTRKTFDITRIATTGYNEINTKAKSTTTFDRMRFIVTGSELRMQILWMYIQLTYENSTGVEKTITYQSYLDQVIDEINTDATNNGYENGYETGYNAGYQVGYDKGIVSEWDSPINIFIEPVDMFLKTNIFGNISIGDILSVILFVMVGIIFIKMFAGG